MAAPELLAQLRPLMTREEVQALLGPGMAKKALDAFSGFERDHGVSITFSHSDGVIDSIRFVKTFSPDVAVCGLRIAMGLDDVRAAMPGIVWSDGREGEPNKFGQISLSKTPSARDVQVRVAMSEQMVALISLQRTDLLEVIATRKQLEVDRRAELDRQRERADRWKSIEDPDAMLLAWAEYCSPWGEPTAKYSVFARWLMTADPDAWHIVATSWNWDYGHAPLKWIVRQQRCDKATALSIFFLGDPLHYLQYDFDRSLMPADNVELFEFLDEIRDRFARGWYTRSEIAYDGAEDTVIKHMLPRQAPDKRALFVEFIPREAMMVLAGRDPSLVAGPNLEACHAMLNSVC